MKCPIETQETTGALLEYGAGRLDAAGAEAMERHLAACPACLQWLEGQRAVWKALDGWDTPPVSADFDRRLYRAIEEAERAPWWRPGRLPWLGFVRRALPAMAAACLLVAAGALVERSPLPESFGRDVRADAVQADQVERMLEDVELLESLNQEVRAPSPL